MKLEKTPSYSPIPPFRSGWLQLLRAFMAKEIHKTAVRNKMWLQIVPIEISTRAFLAASP
jgi:hypothetical protein